MSMADWMKFVEIHLRAARAEAAPILKPETFRTLQTPPKGQDYAKGWIVASRPWAGGEVLTHTGSNTVWFCCVWVAPAKNCALFAATNVGDAAAQSVTDLAVTAILEMGVRAGT